MASFYHSIQNVNNNLWVYNTGGKCVVIAKVFEKQSGRSGFYVAVSDVALKMGLDGEEAPFYELNGQKMLRDLMNIQKSFTRNQWTAKKKNNYHCISA
jgi:hypothetical protein